MTHARARHEQLMVGCQVRRWAFSVKQKSESYILINEKEDYDEEGESHVYRAAKNRNKIKMVMFLCAQARPRWDNNTNQMWDGKVGICPYGEYMNHTSSNNKCELTGSSRYYPSGVEESKGKQRQVQGTTFGDGDTSNQQNFPTTMIGIINMKRRAGLRCSKSVGRWRFDGSRYVNICKVKVMTRQNLRLNIIQRN